MLCAANSQEVHDMAIVAHVSTLKTGIPFLHFFDGYNTSHELMKTWCLKYSDMKKLFPKEETVKHLRDKALTTIDPVNRGSG
jgi:pyruvate-ferredoxin/flavodoxin oxidoreductase